MFKIKNIRKEVPKEEKEVKEIMIEKTNENNDIDKIPISSTINADNTHQNGVLSDSEDENKHTISENGDITSHELMNDNTEPLKASMFPLKSIKKSTLITNNGHSQDSIDSSNDDDSHEKSQTNHDNENSINHSSSENTIDESEMIQDETVETAQSDSADTPLVSDANSVDIENSNLENEGSTNKKVNEISENTETCEETNSVNVHSYTDDTIQDMPNIKSQESEEINEKECNGQITSDFKALVLSDECFPFQNMEFFPDETNVAIKNMTKHSLNDIVDLLKNKEIDICPYDVVILQLGHTDLSLKSKKENISSMYEKVIETILSFSETIQVLVSFLVPRPNLHHFRLLTLRMIDCGLKRVFNSLKYADVSNRIYFSSDIIKKHPFSASDLNSYFEIEEASTVPNLNEEGYALLKDSILSSLKEVRSQLNEKKANNRKRKGDVVSDKNPTKVSKLLDESELSDKTPAIEKMSVDGISDRSISNGNSDKEEKMEVDGIQNSRNSSVGKDISQTGADESQENVTDADELEKENIPDFDINAKKCVLEVSDEGENIRGFVVETVNDGLHYIWNVQTETAAYFACLEKFDRIVEINSENVESLSNEEVIRLIQSEGTLELLVVNKKADKFFKTKKVSVSKEMKELIVCESKDKNIFNVKYKKMETDNESTEQTQVEDTNEDTNVDELLEFAPGTRALILTDEKLLEENLEFLPSYFAHIKYFENTSLKQLHSLLITDELDVSQYNVILLQFGILDLFQKQHKDDITSDFEKVLTTIHSLSPHTHIVLSSMIPRPKIHCLRLLALRVIDCALKRLLQEKCKITTLIKKIHFISDMKNTKPIAFSNAVLGEYFEVPEDELVLPKLNEKGMEICKNSLGDYLKWAWTQISQSKALKRRQEIIAFLEKTDEAVVKPIPLIKGFDETNIPLEIREEIRNKESGDHGCLREHLPDWVEEAEKKKLSQFIPDTVDKIIALELQELNLNKKMTIHSTIKVGNYIIHKGYSNEELMKKTSTDFVDFNELGTRIAYLIRYFPTHAYAIKHHLSNALGIIELPGGDSIYKDSRVMGDWVRNQKETNIIKIACFGGGPGSDVLGILDFLNEVSPGFTIQLAMFDKFVYWENTLRKMIDILVKNGVDIKLKFVEVDFLKLDDIMKVIEYVRHAHIITMCKFVSAIRAYDTETKQGLNAVFENMAPGALIFFMDNKGGGSYQLFNTVAKESDLFPVYSFIHGYPMPEGALHHFKKYRIEYGMRPASILTIAVMMYVKQPLESSETCFDYTPARRVPRMTFDQWDLDVLYQDSIDPMESLQYEPLYFR